MKDNKMSDLPKNTTLPQPKPNETSGVGVEGHIKIFDPVS